MAGTTQDKAIDATKLVATIAKGWKLVDTPKVRAGFKKGQQKLVQADGKTLGMVTMREKGVRVEGARLARNLSVTNATEAAAAHKLLAAVEQENKRKASEREAKKTPQPKSRPTGAKSTTAQRAEAIAGKRARSRSATPRATKVA